MADFMRFDSAFPAPRQRPSASPLLELAFEPNPGNLRAFQYLPQGLKPDAPLVVILHGCGQSAQGYDLGAGWSELADQMGFALLAPEQKATNNPGTCFNWFLPEDTARGEGEAASIAAMIAQMVRQHALDKTRVFITGLSAGGAMTAAMLASYPDLFAGGAIIAGLPYRAAVNVRDALDAMKSAPLKTPRQWGDLIRAASPKTRAWPRVAIWHGAGDLTVNINNAQASVAQWSDLHGLSLMKAQQDLLPGAIRLRWGNKLELVTIAGLPHGTPIDSRDVGQAAPFILDVGISSSRDIAQFWGLVETPAAAPEEPALPRIEDVVAPRLHTEIEVQAESLVRRVLRAVWRR